MDSAQFRNMLENKIEKQAEAQIKDGIVRLAVLLMLKERPNFARAIIEEVRERSKEEVKEDPLFDDPIHARIIDRVCDKLLVLLCQDETKD